MRAIPTALVAGLLLSTAAVPATAQTIIDPEAPLSEPEQPQDEALLPPIDDVPLVDDGRADRLDELFAELKRTPDARRAGGVADAIWAQWHRSGSASIDLMMKWANDAAGKRRNAMALDFLDQVVIRAPDFAEGWNRRATLHFSMNNYAKSMNDIHKVLALEPRHFGALSGMATILERTGNKAAALEAWQRALTVYPAMRSAQEAVIRLSDDLAGEPA
ncbi:MAG: tetratricopeptide repeat protein [Phyllobacteriaceae bacterium]|jgi:tetratricopeptide (TPR) repeat protein|nr:tetratricopeptide repeat protein [Phyllobacteriaceae bacterium]